MPHFKDTLAGAAKRSFDIITSGLGLVALSPLFVIIAVLIKVDSNGPVLFRGVRTGRGGVLFHIYKFRTMVVNADQLGGGSTAKDDPRITRIGHTLRRHKLDELPQLFNVIIGEMSIVGPRPELPQYTKMYSGDEKLILAVRPGITDYASIEFVRLGDILGNENPDVVYEERVKPIKNALRIKYVREQSLLGDIVLIIKTIIRLFTR